VRLGISIEQPQADTQPSQRKDGGHLHALGMPIGTIMHTGITATSRTDFGGDEE